PGPEATPAASAHVDQQYLNNSVNPALVLYLAERRKMDGQAESDPLRHRFEMTPNSPRALPAADFSYMHGINLMASTPVLPVSGEGASEQQQHGSGWKANSAPGREHRHGREGSLKGVEKVAWFGCEICLSVLDPGSKLDPVYWSGWFQSGSRVQSPKPICTGTAYLPLPEREDGLFAVIPTKRGSNPVVACRTFPNNTNCTGCGAGWGLHPVARARHYVVGILYQLVDTFFLPRTSKIKKFQEITPKPNPEPGCSLRNPEETDIQGEKITRKIKRERNHPTKGQKPYKVGNTSTRIPPSERERIERNGKEVFTTHTSVVATTNKREQRGKNHTKEHKQHAPSAPSTARISARTQPACRRHRARGGPKVTLKDNMLNDKDVVVPPPCRRGTWRIHGLGWERWWSGQCGGQTWREGAFGMFGSGVEKIIVDALLFR
ncbi:hypothetical protein B0H14DRAFT_3647642, partial [Mycena olivaceomarginata]